MKTFRTLPVILAALLAAFQSSEGIAAKPKKWEMLHVALTLYVADTKTIPPRFPTPCFA